MTGEYGREQMIIFEQLKEQWKKEAKKIGIEWPITFLVKDDINTCMVVSDEIDRTHEIWILQAVLQNPDIYDVDVMHELSHAKISETVDPTFSTINFSTNSLEGHDGDRAQEFRKLAVELRTAWLHVDIWINDARDAVWPELTKKDILSFFDNFKKLADAGHKDFIERLDTVIAVATNMSEAKRHLSKKQQPDPQAVMRRYTNVAVRQLIVKLTNHFETLPKLGEDKTKNLKILEQSVQKVAQILGFSIKPFMVEENGRIVWDFGV